MYTNIRRSIYIDDIYKIQNIIYDIYKFNSLYIYGDRYSDIIYTDSIDYIFIYKYIYIYGDRYMDNIYVTGLTKFNVLCIRRSICR